MALFKIGQWVRIRAVDTPLDEHLVGEEATVTSGVIVIEDDRTGQVVVGHRLDILSAPLPEGESWVLPADCLEPIQYDGNKVIEWEECLWQPSHVRETQTT